MRNTMHNVSNKVSVKVVFKTSKVNGCSSVIDVKELGTEWSRGFGVTVTIENLDTEEQKTYMIVGDDEADFKINKISVNSPIARGLLGKSEGDEQKFKPLRVKLNTKL